MMALVVGLLWLISSGLAWAQTDATATPVAARQVTPDEVNAVAREIWCPLCSGVRLDACELKACEQMKDVIAIKLAEGEDTASIKAYFVEQYGPQVMGEPPRQGFNWLAWILPAVAVVLGAFFFWRTTQRMVKTDAVVASTPVKPSAGQATANAKPNVGEDDEYMQKLEEELAKYG
jgi:cytochrome c-type biogenesis protein CcmH